MPGRDRTGPAGAGPKTGRAMGICAGFEMPGYASRLDGQGSGMGYGRRGRKGQGYAFGKTLFGRNRLGIRNKNAPSEELGDLKQQAEILKDSLDQINGRIENLSK